MRKIILLLLLQCSLAAVGQEKPKIFFSNKTIDLGIIPSEKTPCVSVNFIFSGYDLDQMDQVYLIFNNVPILMGH